jgi:protein SCO1
MRRRELLARFVAGSPTGVAGAVVGPVRFAETAAPTTGPRAGYFPNVLLRTQDNKEVRFYDDLIKGKIVLISMFYVDCEGLCPLTTQNLKRVHEELGQRVGKDVFIYSITLKPEHDGPRELKEYAAMHGIKQGWTLLTGAPADIEKLRRRLGFTDLDPEIDKDKSQHTGIVRYGNEALDRWGACPALSNPKEIAKYVLWMDAKSTAPRGS